MRLTISRVEIRHQQDVVCAGQRARQIAELLGFDRHDQNRISTAVSEIARNAHQHGKGGETEFLVDAATHERYFTIVVRDSGPGVTDIDAILAGGSNPGTTPGMGLLGARRMMDRFVIESNPGLGTTVCMSRRVPDTSPEITPAVVDRIAQVLLATGAETPLEDIRTQNRELLAVLDDLRARDEELTRVNSELARANTEMATLNQDLQKKTERLEQTERTLRLRNEELKGFAYTISHDLKAPLRGIAGYAQELERKHRTGLSERALFCLSQILTATRNLERLIEDLLQYSRLDAETPSLVAIDLRDLVDGALRSFNETIARGKIELAVDLPEVKLRVWERGLLQVLTNLIDNAIKYSRNSTPPRIVIKAQSLDNSIRIMISDNGVGFDIKYADRIFGLFNRLVRMDEYEGSGAGLAIAKKVVDKIGGRIWAESTPGQGATFFLDIPNAGG